jgi:hypothetical protein
MFSVRSMDLFRPIIFGYNFSPLGADITKLIGITKKLSRFAR